MNGLIVDFFAGGGGASEGMRIGLGRDPDVAVNHDPEAIAMHKANAGDGGMKSDHFVRDMDIAESKAFDSLARYKFMMFGYWAAVWVHLNRISGAKRPNPFKALVKQARTRRAA